MFSWDTRKAILNDEKHRVPFEEAVTILDDPDALDWEDLKHSEAESRFKRIGKSIEGRLLIVVYTVRRMKNGPDKVKETIRLINARQASRKERKAYPGQ